MQPPASLDEASRHFRGGAGGGGGGGGGVAERYGGGAEGRMHADLVSSLFPNHKELIQVMMLLLLLFPLLLTTRS